MEQTKCFVHFLLCSWGILFSHPKDFTPVCTTELARAAKLSGEFKKRDVKMIALSIDSVEDHCKWSKVWEIHTLSAVPPVSLNQDDNYVGNTLTSSVLLHCVIKHQCNKHQYNRQITIY